MKNILLTLMVFGLVGCTTPYQSKGITGGYTETQISENIWKVSAAGNAFTSTPKLNDYALLRASELTINKGYKYFVVVNKQRDGLWNTNELFFEMTNDKKDESGALAFTYNAKMLYQSLSEKYLKDL